MTAGLDRLLEALGFLNDSHRWMANADANHERAGIWGGMSDRKRARARRRKVAA
jgi:hypothetical protein